MVGVVLDLAVNPFELGDILVQKGQVVHVAEGLGGTARAPHDFQEHLGDGTVAPEAVIDKMQVVANLPLDVGTQFQLVFLGQQKSLHQRFRTFTEQALAGRFQFTAVAEEIITQVASSQVAEDAGRGLFFLV